jgi:ADP-ribose pyrophosphatase YjhB (NUDIX family)
MAIRNAAKALVIKDGKLLINKNQNTLGDMCYGLPNGTVYYDLPGGGQNQYETLEDAVIRECIEESGYTVAVERLAAVYEEISMHEGFRSGYQDYAHKINFIFICH